ncbi:Methylated-DNA--protein-cysteine methyltransferase [Botrimarina colliarenosi]|uniref:Methylated-DNA--protein-cysteine methyltransferase n=1 Tax=Botrimarina colliarenosi TaxID=2528001 RepID=A0A5C6AKL4_9BACT|nr:methylated-DNA--[protein]-cysteine S-methyltransferase [Botrimarina colliarenosi]TWU00565.1 Methylated-DNA--protein-cysteine methyltransferase [Botrimarina colliarenosi]
MTPHRTIVIATPLGPMTAVADESALKSLQFGATPEATAACAGKVLSQIEAELAAYFAGELTDFETPVAPEGTPFQLRVWRELQQIPCGETRSYAAIANALGDPKATRAVGTANGANPIAIIVPCHRVIRTGGALGGYAGGLDAKRWLLDHERQHVGQLLFI